MTRREKRQKATGILKKHIQTAMIETTILKWFPSPINVNRVRQRNNKGDLKLI